MIGGAAAFAEALAGRAGVIVDTIHLTRVYVDTACDVHIPAIDDTLYAMTGLKPRQTEGGCDFQFFEFKNRSINGLIRSPRPSSAPRLDHEELQYLDAIRWVRMPMTGYGGRHSCSHTPAYHRRRLTVQ